MANPLVERLKRLQARIDEALQRSGRTRDSLTLVAISKYAKHSDMETLCEAGVRTFGENRVQDALPKQQLLMDREIDWHFTGHLQGNKVKRVVGAFSLIHSVDTYGLAEALNREAERRQMVQPVLVQVNVSQEPGKYGIQVGEAVEMVLRIAHELPGLRVKGYMAMAPRTEDTGLIRASFRQLGKLRDQTLTFLPAGTGLEHLSMGMTQDFEVAIEEGATMVRIGSGLFG